MVGGNAAVLFVVYRSVCLAADSLFCRNGKGTKLTKSVRSLLQWPGAAAEKHHGGLQFQSMKSSDSRQSRPCWTGMLDKEIKSWSFDYKSHLHKSPKQKQRLTSSAPPVRRHNFLLFVCCSVDINNIHCRSVFCRNHCFSTQQGKFFISIQCNFHLLSNWPTCRHLWKLKFLGFFKPQKTKRRVEKIIRGGTTARAANQLNSN